MDFFLLHQYDNIFMTEFFLNYLCYLNYFYCLSSYFQCLKLHVQDELLSASNFKSEFHLIFVFIL